MLKHKKIAVIGCGGSGKTYVSFYLQKKFGLPLFHLDQYYWKPSWKRSESLEFATLHDKLCEKDTWIIEGSYTNFLRYRVLHADMVVFLDMPRYLCVWRVLKRAMINFGNVIPGDPEGCQQRIISLEFFYFLRWIWNFNTRTRGKIMKILREFEHEKKIYILNTPSDVQSFLAAILEN